MIEDLSVFDRGLISFGDLPPDIAAIAVPTRAPGGV